MTTLSPIRRAEQNYPRLLRCNTVNQRHATAQHNLNKQLPHELKNELGLETTRDEGSSSQSIETTQITSQTAARNCLIYHKLHFRSFDKHKGPKTGRREPADQRHTKKRVFHVIGIIKTRFINESDCFHFCNHTNQYMHFSC